MTYSVPFADYEADMKESAEFAAAIIRQLRRRAADRDRFIAAIVEAAGGEVRIPIEIFSRPPATLTQWEDVADHSIIFKVTR
ncbi:hypothetical protein EVC29_112 [Rhizobium phage RHph_Y52]|nr:hypothetical protein EVC16_112 [Rhizobium phage RHph_Y21]QIG76813.1 hypothetical protein EVC29_112 [Rhizobium phage RHph_Y52]